jgi:hypothetical protein
VQVGGSLDFDLVEVVRRYKLIKAIVYQKGTSKYGSSGEIRNYLGVEALWRADHAAPTSAQADRDRRQVRQNLIAG